MFGAYKASTFISGILGMMKGAAPGAEEGPAKVSKKQAKLEAAQAQAQQTKPGQRLVRQQYR